MLVSHRIPELSGQFCEQLSKIISTGVLRNSAGKKLNNE